MKVAYVQIHQNLEEQLVAAFRNRKEGMVSIAKQQLLLPIIVNFTATQMPILQKVLEITNYREMPYFDKAVSKEEFIEKSKARMERVIESADSADLDLVVVYAKGMNLEYIEGAIAKCM